MVEKLLMEIIDQLKGTEWKRQRQNRNKSFPSWHFKSWIIEAQLIGRALERSLSRLDRSIFNLFREKKASNRRRTNDNNKSRTRSNFTTDKRKQTNNNWTTQDVWRASPYDYPVTLNQLKVCLKIWITSWIRTFISVVNIYILIGDIYTLELVYRHMLILTIKLFL